MSPLPPTVEFLDTSATSSAIDDVAPKNIIVLLILLIATVGLVVPVALFIAASVCARRRKSVDGAGRRNDIESGTVSSNSGTEIQSVNPTANINGRSESPTENAVRETPALVEAISLALESDISDLYNDVRVEEEELIRDDRIFLPRENPMKTVVPKKPMLVEADSRDSFEVEYDIADANDDEIARYPRQKKVLLENHAVDSLKTPAQYETSLGRPEAWWAAPRHNGVDVGIRMKNKTTARTSQPNDEHTAQLGVTDEADGTAACGIGPKMPVVTITREAWWTSRCI